MFFFFKSFWRGTGAVAVTFYRKIREGGLRLTTDGDNRIYRH